jgi:hypothetical protein
MLALRLLAAVPVAILIASCAAQPMGPDRNVRSQARLAQALAGKVPGRPVSCLPHYRNNDMEVIDSDTILFRDGRTTYVQHTNGGCYPNGTNIGYTLVTKTIGSGGLCRGDIATVIDNGSRFFAGSCSFNDFIPYRTP